MGKRPSTESGSAEKKRQRKGTILEAFAAAGATRNAPSGPLEVTEALGVPLSNYDSQNIRNTLAHHLSDLQTKRQWVSKSAEHTPSQEKPARGQKASSSDEDLAFGLPGYDEQRDNQDWTIGDDDAYRYLCQLRELTSERMMPTKEQIKSIVAIVRTHGLHGRKDLSSTAFNLLQLVAKWHPSVIVRAAEGNSNSQPCVVTNSNAWTLIDSCETLSLNPMEAEPPTRRISPFQLLSHLISLAQAAVVPQKAGLQSPRSIVLGSGDLLLFKWIVSELELDLRCRLKVFSMVTEEGFAAKKLALLQNSQLWRTFSGSVDKGLDKDRKEMLASLMQIIAAPADSETLATPSSPDVRAFSACELSDLAGQLLRMLLELYGTAEDAGAFQKHGVNRTSTIGVLDNMRMMLEIAMVNGLVGSAQVLLDLQQKRAFLAVLHPKDRMRLLTMIVATGHARRKTDTIKYPGLERFNFLYTNPGDVDSFLMASPVEALQYIVDDLHLALNLVDKSADGLALLVSLLAQAAASELTGAVLAQLGGLLERLIQAFAKHDNAASAKTLSAAGKMSLHAAQAAIAVAG